MPAAPVTPPAPPPPAPTYLLGGSVSGLASGAAVTVTSGADSVTVNSNGPFSFPTRLAAGASYSVSSNPPAGHTCSVGGGAGAVGSADVASVAVKCTAFLLAGVDRTIKNGTGVAVDAAGATYVLDKEAEVVLKIAADNTVSVFAGTRHVRGHADGAGATATFDLNAFSKLVSDNQGNLYLTDTCNGLIRKITPAGVVSTVAGSFQASCLSGVAAAPVSADGSAGAAKFFLPSQIAVDASGNLAVSESTLRTIRRISAAGIVTTEDPISAARTATPSALAFDNNGALLIASNGSSQRRIWRANGNTSVLIAGVSLGSQAQPVGTPSLGSYIGNINAMAVDKDGNVLVASSPVVIKLSPSSTVSLVAGTPGSAKTVDGTGGAASFSTITAMAIDATGKLTVLENSGLQVRTVTAAGVVSTSPATPVGREYADGKGAAARFAYADWLASAPDGNLYTLDALHHVVRKIAPDGTVSLFAGQLDQAGNVNGAVASSMLTSPSALAVDRNGAVYVSDLYGVRKIDNGTVTLLNVPLTLDFSGYLRVLPNGDLVISGFSSVTVLSPAGAVRATIDATTTAAAAGVITSANTLNVTGVEVDSSGNVFIADSYHNVVWRYGTDGKLSLFAGTIDAARNADGAAGTGALSFELGRGDLAIDASDNLYIGGSGAVRKISPQGVISTPALAWGNRDVFGLTVRNGLIYGTISAAILQTPLP